jgi:hypothetical protein
MRIPASHSDIVKEETRVVLSTINQLGEVYTAFCTVRFVDDNLMIYSIDDENIKQIKMNNKISILSIDPLNVDRWFCIQGSLSPFMVKESQFVVKIDKVIIFPKNADM